MHFGRYVLVLIEAGVYNVKYILSEISNSKIHTTVFPLFFLHNARARRALQHDPMEKAEIHPDAQADTENFLKNTSLRAYRLFFVQISDVKNSCMYAKKSCIFNSKN